MGDPRQPRGLTRKEIVTYGSFALFVAGLVIVGVGLANLRVEIILIGVAAMALPLLRWFRIKRSPEGEWTFEGALEKPPDSVSGESGPADEQEQGRPA